MVRSVFIYNVGTFPWDLMIHLCIVFMTTLQIMAMVETTNAYSRRQANLLYFKFLNHDDD